MSKPTDSNLFIVSSVPALYQRLFNGAVGYQELGNRLLGEINTAQAFRQVERVRELAKLLFNLPLKEFQLIARYYLIWCKCRELNYQTGVLERIAEQTQTYKVKALSSRGTFEWYKGNNEAAFYFYSEALKASPTISEYIDLTKAIAVLKSQEGFHGLAIKDLDALLPITRHADPLVYYEFLNSYAVELASAGRSVEAENASLVAVSSPFGPYYPEWQETFRDVRAPRKRRSTVSISLPQEKADKTEYIEVASNVLQFPSGERVLQVRAALESDELRELSLTPLQLLALILKMMLEERVSDDEVEKICVLYYDTVTKWYPQDWPSGI